MPTPTAERLKRPLMKFSFGRSDASGSRLLPSSISAPAPLAHQCVELMPQAMNSAAKRLGKVGAAFSAGRSSPHTLSDSSHGRAIATPAPCNNTRRESELGMVAPQFSSLRHELRAGDNRLNQAAESIVLRRQPATHGIDQAVVR